MKPLTPTQEKKFWLRVNKTSTHWLWTGSVSGRGYGQYHASTKQRTTAHRWSWMIHYGPIPKGFQIHHKCEVQLCIKPSHLELLTVKAHVALHPRANSKKTHCSRGHPFKDNVYRYIDKYGSHHRRCAICHRAKVALYRKRKESG